MPASAPPTKRSPTSATGPGPTHEGLRSYRWDTFGEVTGAETLQNPANGPGLMAEFGPILGIDRLHALALGGRRPRPCLQHLPRPDLRPRRPTGHPAKVHRRAGRLPALDLRQPADPPPGAPG